MTAIVGLIERCSLKRVQHDALEQISQGDVEVLGERLENLQEASLDAHPV